MIMRIKFVIILILFVSLVLADFKLIMRCLLNCGPNLVNPYQFVGLSVSCDGDCDGVTYHWSMEPSIYSHQLGLREDQVDGINSPIFIIKENELLTDTVHQIYVRATVGNQRRKAGIIFQTDKCSKKYPCHKETMINDDYIEQAKETTKAPRVFIEHPEKVLKDVKSNIKVLQSFDKNSQAFNMKQKKMIKHLTELPLDVSDVLDKTAETLSQVLKASHGALRPDIARKTAVLTEKIVDAALRGIVNSKDPKAQSSSVQTIANIAFNAIDRSLNVNTTLFKSHRTTEMPVIISVTIPPIYREKYEDYNDFDIIYQGKLKSTIQVAKDTISIVKKIGHATALTSSGLVSKIVISGVCILNINEQTELLSNKSFDICDETIYISDKLAKELSRKFKSASISFAVIKKNPFWFNPQSISTNVVTIEIVNTATRIPVRYLKNPIHYYAKIKTANEFVTGFVNVSEDAIDILSEQSICVHQLFIFKDVKTLRIQFKDIAQNDALKVVVFRNFRPSHEHFQKAYNISSALSTINIYANAPKGTFYYVGVMPSKETLLNSGRLENNIRTYKYSVQFTSLYCHMWNEKLLDWLEDTCDVSLEASVDKMHCKCTHLSTYSASVTSIENKINTILLVDIRLLRKFNFIIHLALASVFLIYFIVLALAFWRDRKRYKPKKVLLLVDNTMFHRYKYILAVFTGKIKNSGTTANIGFKLHGSNSATEPHLLRGHEEPVLQTGNEDFFLLYTPRSLGELKAIDLWTDSYGMRNSWYCKKIVVYNLENNKEWIFEVDKWLSVLNNTVFLTSKVVSMEKFEPKTRWDFAKTALMNEHFWFSIFRRAKYPAFTYVEKISVMFGTVISCMFFAFLLRGPPSYQLYGQLGIGHYELRFVDVFVSLGSAMFSFIICYGWSKPFHQTSLTRQFVYKYPKRWRKIAWICVMNEILLFTASLSIFGLWLGYIPSYLWLTCSAIAILLCFLMETIRVLIIAYLKRETSKAYIDKAFNLSHISAEKRILKNRYGANGLRPILHTMYQPLSEFDIKMKQEKELQRIQLRNICIDIIMFLVYLIILLSVVLMNKDSLAFANTKHMKEIFVNSEYSRGFSFTSINTERRLMRYLRETFIPALYSNKWYGNYTTDETGLLMDFNTKLLGIPQLRQIRIRRGTCRVPSAMKYVKKECKPEYSSFIQSKEDFGPGWRKRNLNRTLEKTDLPWMYQTGTQSQSTSVIGDLAYYPSGGYFALFGRNKQNSFIVLQYIEKMGWIDDLTRVLFIEACFYNANQNLFTILTLMIEVSATGKFINSYNIRTAKLLFRMDELAIATFITFTLFFIMILILSWKKIKQLRTSAIRTFLADIWNVIDVSIILFAFTFLIVYFVRTKSVSYLLNALEESEHNEYVGFYSALFWDDCVTIIATILVAVSTVRAWRLLRFLRLFRICELTIQLAGKYLIAMFAIKIIVMFIYSSSGYIVFGAYAIEFRSIGESFVTLFLLAFGFNRDFNYTVFENAYGYLYYFFYMILLLIVINLFITIIIVAYEAAKDFFDESDTENLVSYNMLQFFRDEFKYFTSKNKGRENIERLKSGRELYVHDHKKHEISHKPGLQRPEVAINQTKLKAMHDIAGETLPVLIRRFERKNIQKTPLELIRFYIQFLNDTTPFVSEQEQQDDELFTTIPDEDGFKFCSKKRMDDMIVIVNYLMKHYGELKLKEQKAKQRTQPAEKHKAILIQINNEIETIIKEFQYLYQGKYADKATNVTFADLGLALIE